LNDVDSKKIVGFKNTTAVRKLERYQGFRRACQADRLPFLLGSDGIELVHSDVLDCQYIQSARDQIAIFMRFVKYGSLYGVIIIA